MHVHVADTLFVICTWYISSLILKNRLLYMYIVMWSFYHDLPVYDKNENITKSTDLGPNIERFIAPCLLQFEMCIYFAIWHNSVQKVSTVTQVLFNVFSLHVYKGSNCMFSFLCSVQVWVISLKMWNWIHVSL